MDKPKDWARLFHTDLLGQVVVMLTRDSDGEPAIKFVYHDGMENEVSVSLSFEGVNEEKSQKALRKTLDELDEETVIKAVSLFHSHLFNESLPS